MKKMANVDDAGRAIIPFIPLNEIYAMSIGSQLCHDATNSHNGAKIGGPWSFRGQCRLIIKIRYLVWYLGMLLTLGRWCIQFPSSSPHYHKDISLCPSMVTT